LTSPLVSIPGEIIEREAFWFTLKVLMGSLVHLFVSFSMTRKLDEQLKSEVKALTLRIHTSVQTSQATNSFVDHLFDCLKVLNV
jgi:hypothetical protein